MESNKVEKVYEVLMELSQIISEDLMLNEIDSTIEAANFWLSKDAFDTMLSESAVYKMEKLVDENDITQFNSEEKYQGITFAFLKAMKNHVSPNHQMTPDVVTLLITYLAKKLLQNKSDLSVLDPIVGTGHLLIEFLLAFKNQISNALGTDVDEMMLDIAEISATYSELFIELDNVDAVDEKGTKQYDVVLADLPEVLKNPEGKPTAIAILDNAIDQTKEGGYLFVVVPESLVSGAYAGDMVRILRVSAHMHALIKLPKSMFANEGFSKNIVVLQKKGKTSFAPKETLLAELPSVSNKEAIAEILRKIDLFFEGIK